MKISEVILETQYANADEFRAAMLKKGKATFKQLSASQRSVLEVMVIAIWKSIKSKSHALTDEDAVFLCLDTELVKKHAEAAKIIATLADSRKQLAKSLAKGVDGLV